MSGLRLAEFLEDSDGRLSISRLMVLFTFIPATIVLLADSDQLVNYLGFYVGGYAAGKVSDVMVANKQAVSDVDSGSISADISVTASKPLAASVKRAGRGKKRPY